MIGHIEADHPRLRLGQFLVVDGKDLSLHTDLEHIHVELPHWGGLLKKRLSKYHPLGRALRLRGIGLNGGRSKRGRNMLLCLVPDTLRFSKKFLGGKLAACVELNMNGCAEAFREPLLNPRQVGLQIGDPVCTQMNMKCTSLCLTAAARQHGRSRRIQTGQQAGHILNVHPRQQCRVIARLEINSPQVIERANALLRPSQQVYGKIDLAAHANNDLPLLDAQVHVLDGILFQKRIGLVPQVQCREQVEQGDVFFHDFYVMLRCIRIITRQCSAEAPVIIRRKAVFP